MLYILIGRIRRKIRFIFLRFVIYLKFILKQTKTTPRIKKKDGPIIIACIVNEDFAMPLTVMVRSMVSNLRSYKKIQLYLLHTVISGETKKKIKYSIDTKKIDLIWTEIDNNKIKDMKIRKHFRIEAYHRLLIPNALPNEIRKVIYLDCDLIVLEDIGKLWGVEIGDNYLCAVPEMGKKTLYVSSPAHRSLFKELGLCPKCKYFNTGVMSINLKKWREDKISSRVINYLNVNKAKIMYVEQDGLNAICANKWGELDPHWNVCAALFSDYLYWQESPFDRNTYNNLIKSPYIVHFTGGLKPWLRNCKHPYKHLFFYYLDKTPWRKWRP